MRTPAETRACVHRVRENTDTTKHSNFPATDENNRPKWPRSIVRGPGTMIACCELGLPPAIPDSATLPFFLIAIISHRLFDDDCGKSKNRQFSPLSPLPVLPVFRYRRISLKKLWRCILTSRNRFSCAFLRGKGGGSRGCQLRMNTLTKKRKK